MKKILMGFLFVSVTVFAADTSRLDRVLARLEQAEKEVRTLSFDFTQTTSLSVGRGAADIVGSALFERPNRFRVEQSAPEPQVIVSNGKVFWVYLPERGQAIKDSMDNWARAAGFPQGLTPFRMNVTEMKKKYDFVLDDTSGQPVLVLTPRDSGSFSYTLRLWIDLNTGLAVKTELESEAVRAVVTVRNAQVNPPIKDAQFKFVPPKGTDVLEMPSAK
ncbi:MAG: outer membrane lipoprotein chaperone LolA [Elusimicrobia bacterium]|nr:outer membrane lipoprotein chaperone LolA [Elusimicrobiota bacterium]